MPKQIPKVDGISVRNSTQKALQFALQFEDMANQDSTNNNFLMDLLNQAKVFSEDANYQKLFPQSVLLMKVSFILYRFMFKN